jgi:hypothetical protein
VAGHSRGGLISKIHLCVDGSGLPLSSWSRPGNAATRQTSVLSSTPFPCLDRGEDVRANAQPPYVSIVLMARVVIDDRSRNAVSAAFALNVMTDPRSDRP